VRCRNRPRALSRTAGACSVSPTACWDRSLTSRTPCRNVLALACGHPRQGVGPESVSNDHNGANLSRFADIGARAARRVCWSLAARGGSRRGSARTRQPHGAGRGFIHRLLLTMDRLSPPERAAILQHDVFDFFLAKWPLRWSGARLRAGSLPLGRVRTCVRHDLAARPGRQRVRARSIRSTPSSCPHSWPQRAPAILRG
jgi:hypothetical protein